jgi:hypothetical protein
MWVPCKECWLKTGSAASRTQQGYFFIPQNDMGEKVITNLLSGNSQWNQMGEKRIYHNYLTHSLEIS